MSEEKLELTAEEVAKLQEDYDNLQIECESLKESETTLLEKVKDLEKELDETKKLNFTLGRQVSRKPSKTCEQALEEMFLKGE